MMSYPYHYCIDQGRYNVHTSGTSEAFSFAGKQIEMQQFLRWTDT